MDKLNVYQYINKYSSFDGVVVQHTNSKGQRQSAWIISATNRDINGNMGGSDNFNVMIDRLQAIDDDIACYLTSGIDGNGNRIDIAIWIKGDGKNSRVYGNYYYDYDSVIYKNGELTENHGNVTTQRIQHNIDLSAYLKLYGANDDTVLAYKGMYGRVIATSYLANAVDVYTNSSINSTPMFNIDDFKSITDYLATGDMDGRVIDYSVDWTVYIDTPDSPSSNIYVDAPPLKIVWRSKNIESALENGLLQDGNVYINVYTYLNNDINDKIDIATVNYTSAYVKTSFRDVCKFNNPSLSDKLFSVLPNKQPVDDITEIYVYMSLYTNTGLYATAKLSMTYNRIYYGVIVGTSIGLDNSSITIVLGTGNDDSGYIPPTIIDDVGDDTNSTNGYDSALGINTVYKLSVDGLHELNGFLWTDDFFSKILSVNSAPIDNILSCKIIPYSVSGSTTSIVLGNVTTDISAQRIKSNVKITIGELLVPTYYDSFLDYAPYTKITIYIPYIGFKELDTDSIMGKTLRVEYVIDMITGTCKALIFADNIYVISYDGQCGIDMAISAVNRGQTEASYVTGALGAIGELASGNVIGAVSTGINTALAPYHYNTQGAYSPSCGSFETKLCYLIIDRPTAQYPTTYGHDVGYPCDLSCTLSSLRGFTVCGDNIDLSGIPCTDTERQQIKDMLTSGVYL